MTTIPIQTHLVRDDNGVLRLGGLKYIMFVSNHVYHDMDAAALAKQYPSLTLGQIHAGLSYYNDHKAELDAELKRREEEADAYYRAHPQDPNLRQKLEARLAEKRRAERGS